MDVILSWQESYTSGHYGAYFFVCSDADRVETAGCKTAAVENIWRPTACKRDEYTGSYCLHY